MSSSMWHPGQLQGKPWLPVSRYTDVARLVWDIDSEPTLCHEDSDMQTRQFQASKHVLIFCYATVPSKSSMRVCIFGMPNWGADTQHQMLAGVYFNFFFNKPHQWSIPYIQMIYVYINIWSKYNVVYQQNSWRKPCCRQCEVTRQERGHCSDGIHGQKFRCIQRKSEQWIPIVNCCIMLYTSWCACHNVCSVNECVHACMLAHMHAWRDGCNHHKFSRDFNWCLSSVFTTPQHSQHLTYLSLPQSSSFLPSEPSTLSQ